jgi:excisionase family DNA binding protein
MRTAEKSKPNLSPSLLDVTQLGAILGCSPRHIRRLVDAGKFPQPTRLGSLVRWSRSSVEEWIADGCRHVRQVRKGGAK